MFSLTHYSTSIGWIISNARKCYIDLKTESSQVRILDVGAITSQAIEYAKKLFADLGRLVMLIIFSMIPVVNWITVGYMAKVIKETPSSDSPPKLEEYGTLLVEGLKISIAAGAYMLLPAILISLGAFSLFALSPFGPGIYPLRFLGAGLGTVLFIIGIVLAFLVAIILSMAIVHMVKTGSFGKAFAISEILSVIKKIGWRSYIAWLVVIVVCSFVVGLLAAIPAVGWIISLIISPVFGVFSSRSAALVCTSAETPSVSTVSVGKKFCISCGRELPEDSKFCGSCGKPQ